MLTHPDGERELLVVGVPGDRDVDMKRLEASVAPAEVEMASDSAFEPHPELVRGYIGPTVLGPNSRSASWTRRATPPVPCVTWWTRASSREPPG